MRTANLDRPLCKVLGCPNRASAKGSFCTSKHYYLLKKELAGEVVKPAAAKRNGEPEPLLPLPARMQPAMHTDHTGPEATEEERCPHCHFLDGRHHPTCFSIHSAEPQPDDDPDTAVNLTLRLTETQCDALYHRCTPGQKAIALSSLLHQLLAI